ncbi:MAG: glycosyltransferase family 2 protein [Planctomycetes bacterium]|jgi:glycosyltransferase involved in cell wall biosynthesis|nr:glycosyltransferase family 2 protein [Planctomycetota bacterium]HPY75062.1 glycosyltransferase family A protein [Planctomycetota bacterium]HQB00723.1 glycosyltransferase family A protein [Planctomycetota bacterium]
MTNPIISIVIPTYNRAYCLTQCIDSIYAQTFKNWELIVVDDGSEDNTAEILTLYIEKGLQYIKQKNAGVSSARNKGLEHAKGMYIAFCDSDDQWIKTKLQMQYNAFQSDQSMILNYTDEIWIRNGKRVNQCKQHTKYSGWIFEKCLDLCIVSPSSVMMHRSFFETVGNFDETLFACEDYDLWLRGAIYYPYHFIDKALIIKTGGHEDQLSRKYWGMDRFRVQSILKCLQNKDISKEQQKAAKNKLQEKCNILIQGAQKRNNIEIATYYEKILETWL